MVSLAVQQETIQTGRVLERMFSAPRASFLPLFAIALMLVALPNFGLQLLVADVAGNPLAAYRSPIAAASGIAWMALSAISMAVVIRVCLDRLIGREPSVADAVSAVLPRSLAIIGVGLLYWIIVLAGSILLIVPGIVAAVGLIAVTPALVEEEIGVFDAIARSWELTSGSKWRIFWLMVIVLILSSLVSGATEIVARAFGGDGTTPGLAGSAVQALTGSLVNVFGGALSAALYLELRVAREGSVTDELALVFQ